MFHKFVQQYNLRRYRQRLGESPQIMVSYQRYSHHARRALSHAEQLARMYQHPRQDTAHLLVGVLLAQGSLGAQVLDDFDLPIPVAQVYLKRLLAGDGESEGSIPVDASLQEALEQAADEAEWLGTHYIGTEHLILGITRTNLGNAIRLLHLLDVTPEQLRRRTRHLIMDGRAEFSLETVRANAKLSELSRRVLNAAEQKAVALDHSAVGLGHLLLALLHERRGVTSVILKQSGLDVDTLNAALQAPQRELLISIELVIGEAINQAEKYGSHYVGADHLLLALSLRDEGVALLRHFSTETEKIKRLLDKHLKD